MKILITGGTGFVGKALRETLIQKGCEVVVVSRTEILSKNQYYWNYKKQEINPKALVGINGIIHLAGANISERWTQKHKEEMFSSRIDSLAFLHQKLAENNQKLDFLLSASGVNYYGTETTEIIYNENNAPAEDYLAQLCVEWENAAHNFSAIAQSITIVRTGVVLDKTGGALAKMLPAFKMNLGGKIGNGKQYFPWISLKDLVNLYVFCIENNISGVYNAVNSNKITQAQFANQLAKSIDKKTFPIAIPAFILKIILGEMSALLLNGSQICAKKIKEKGFVCKIEKINDLFENKK